MIFTACSSEPPPDSTPATPAATSAEPLAETNDTPVYSGEGYTFEFSDSGDNYIISAVLSDTDIIFTVEDRNYRVSTCVDSLPAGFSPGPLGASNCFVLSDRFAPTPKKQLLEVIFTEVGTPSPDIVAKIYGIKDGVFMPLDAYDNSTYQMKYTGTIADSVLLPTEPNKFMAPPAVAYSQTGSAVTTIYTYTFDPNAMSFTKAEELTTPANPLYFGYSCLAVANDLYSYFTDSTLKLDTSKSFTTYTNTSTGDSESYFPVSDPRFSTLSEYEEYIKRFFSDSITAEMFRNAPEKYRDIGGILNTVQVKSQRDPTYGGVILTNYLAEDVDIVFPTEQFRTIDGVTSLMPGGEFIVQTTGGPEWNVVQYKYPYK
jgi:hypothetical protein